MNRSHSDFQRWKIGIGRGEMFRNLGQRVLGVEPGCKRLDMLQPAGGEHGKIDGRALVPRLFDLFLLGLWMR